MAGLTSVINNFNKNKFIVRFSNIPDFTGKGIDVHVLNNYLKSFQIPDISISTLASIYGHTRQLHPNTIGSRDLQTINIVFNIDEEMKNWFLLYSWLYAMRHGKTCGRKNLKEQELVRMDNIDSIDIIFLTNEDEIVSKLSFKNCVLNNIGSIELEYGASELGSFVTTFEVEDIEFNASKSVDKILEEENIIDS